MAKRVVVWTGAAVAMTSFEPSNRTAGNPAKMPVRYVARFVPVPVRVLALVLLSDQVSIGSASASPVMLEDFHHAESPGALAGVQFRCRKISIYGFRNRST
jgi:hypothetical protein